MDTATQKAHFFRRVSFGATQQELGSSAKPKELLEHWLEDKQPMTEKVRQTVLESTQAVRELVRDVDQRVQHQGYSQGDLGKQLALVSRLLEVRPLWIVCSRRTCRCR